MSIDVYGRKEDEVAPEAKAAAAMAAIAQLCDEAKAVEEEEDDLDALLMA